jgi:hypothetical protein
MWTCSRWVHKTHSSTGGLAQLLKIGRNARGARTSMRNNHLVGGDQLYRSAWLKWAHAVEIRNELARAVVAYRAGKPHRYDRFDNLDDGAAALVSMHWKLRVLKPHPEPWSILTWARMITPL